MTRSSTSCSTRTASADDIHLFNDKLREWEDYYNYHRPHGALDGQTPYERLVAKTRAGVSPSVLGPYRPLYPAGGAVLWGRQNPRRLQLLRHGGVGVGAPSPHARRR